MGRKRYYDEPMDMSRRAMENRAKSYAGTIRGWQCPECYAYVRAGEDVCYVCGTMPELDYPSGADEDTTNLSLPASMGWFVFFFLAPIMYEFVSTIGWEEPEVSVFALFPIGIMIWSGIKGFRYIWVFYFGSPELYKKYNDENLLDNTTYYSIFVRGWVMYFSLRAAWLIIVPVCQVFVELFEWEGVVTFFMERKETLPVIGAASSLIIIFIVGVKILVKQRRTHTSGRGQLMRLLKATGLLILAELFFIPVYTFLYMGLISEDYWRTISSFVEFFKVITPIHWYVILTVAIAFLMRKYAKTHTAALTIFILVHVAILAISVFMYMSAYMVFF